MNYPKHSVGMRVGLCCVLVAALASCTTLQSGNGPGSAFERKYFDARKALESNNYDVAITRYARLAEDAGPLESRIRLELAHALLRADRYEDAASQASRVASAHDGPRRSAALAVKGTADHKRAQLAMSEGQFDARTVQLLKSAKSALSEMLVDAPEQDTYGSMRHRLGQIDRSLANIGKG